MYWIGSADIIISEEGEVSSSPLKRKWMSLSEEARDDIKTTVISFAFALFVRVVLLCSWLYLNML